MKLAKRKQKPISLAGCCQVLEHFGIQKAEWSEWTLGMIFSKAEELYEEGDFTPEEVYISMEEEE